MPALSGAFPAYLRWLKVWPTCQRRPRMLVRRGGLVLASRLTPDAARRPGCERRKRWHTGGAEPARNACGRTSNIWTASEPLCGPLAVQSSQDLRSSGPACRTPARWPHQRKMARAGTGERAGSWAAMSIQHRGELLRLLHVCRQQREASDGPMDPRWRKSSFSAPRATIACDTPICKCTYTYNIYIYI
jgi:hypothetical protein